MRELSLLKLALLAATLPTAASRDGHVITDAPRRLANRHHSGHIRSPVSSDGAHQHGADRRTACIILMTKNEWPTLRSWVLHHGDLVGFENLHVIDNSDEASSVEYIQRARDKYGISVTYSKRGMEEKDEELTSTALGMQPQCDFIFKLDTDEFLGVHQQAENTLRVDGNAFHAELRRLPMDGRKYLITYRKELLKQRVCRDNALATDFGPIKVVGPYDSNPKMFYPARSVVSIDTGSHTGMTTVDGLVKTNMAILHLHNKCYEVYMKNIKEILLSRDQISANQTDKENFDALDRQKDRFTVWCGMKSCHKAREYHAYLKDPEGHRRDYVAGAAGGGEPQHALTALRDRVGQLQLKYGDV